MGDTLAQNLPLADKDLATKYLSFVERGKDISWNSILYTNLSTVNFNLNQFGNTYNTMVSLYLLIGAVLIIPSLMILIYLGLSNVLSTVTVILLSLVMITIYITLLFIIRQALASYFSPLYNSIESIRQSTNLLTNLFNFTTISPNYTF
jgi:hypothetical protein